MKGNRVVSSCFPSINTAPVKNQSFGYVWWGGRSFLEGSQGGVWDGTNDKQGPGVGTGDGGGPFVVFGEDMTDSLVFSPASNFMTNTPGMSPAPTKHNGDTPSSAPKTDGSFCFGLDAPVTSVPAGYSLESMVFLGSGVNKAMKDWGTTLLKKYGTIRPVDYAAQHLGFSTDNGAYYYYGWNHEATDHNPDYKNYQEALEGVYAYSKAEGIPYKHILLDSWWYSQGDGGGLKEWDATNSTFPDGLKTFANKTQWKFQMHNRFWADDNVYAKQNGGKYDFMIDDSTKYAMPLEQDLWDDLIANKTEGGIPLSVYEQDWLYNEWQGVGGARESPTLARQWLMQMGKGAAKQNTTVQYCMALTRHVLQTVEIPAVTTIRASDDYGPGQTGGYPVQEAPGQPITMKGTCSFPYCVYYVGTSSIIAHALDLRPSKDNYWSTPLQQGSAFQHQHNPWKPTMLNDTHEPYNEMQSAISSYTTAQVAPSDGVGFSNASLINMACRSDGRLLQPSAPARSIDASFALAGGPQPNQKHVHAVMATHSIIGVQKWTHVLTIGLNASFKLLPKHLGDDFGGQGAYLVWTGYQPSGSVGKRPANVTLLGGFSDTAPLVLPACAYSDFGLYQIAPIQPNSNLAFLGEIGKWVPTAAARVVTLTDNASHGLSVAIIGVVDEMVELAFAASGTGATVTVLCKIGPSAAAVATFDGKVAKCVCI
jgi:hypothetical protein